MRGLRPAAAVTILVLGVLARLPLSGQAPPLGAEEQVFLQRLAERYRAARQTPGGLAVSPGTVADRLVGGQPITLLDVRSRAGFDAGHAPGSRSLPLAALLSSGGRIDPWQGPLVVVGGEETEAVEAMVFLRLAGAPATVMSGDVDTLLVELSSRGEAPREAPQLPPQEPAPAPQPPEDSPAQPAPQPTPQETAPPAGTSRVLPRWLIAAVALLAVALAGVLVYFLVWLPRKRRRRLLEAFRILEEEREAEFPDAADHLNAALTSGLRSRDVAEARFALAYVRARLGQLSEASAILADLPPEGRGREIVYLDLWLRAQQKKWDEVERLYDGNADLLGDLLQSKLLAGIAFLQLGRSALARRDTDRALAYFDRLRRLGVLNDELPGDIEDHQIVLGIEALFDRDVIAARKRFTGALESAGREGRQTHYSELGLLLCDWRETDLPDVDGRLGAIAAKLEAGRNAPAEAPERLREEDRLLRDVLLWHAVSLLFAWRLRFPQRTALLAASRRELEERLDKVRRIDPEMSDPLLLGGLIRYYFAESHEERTEAVESLEQAIRGEVHLPEVGLLVAREKKLAEAAQRSLEIYLGLVKRYLAEQGVPLKLRQRLLERFERFARFKELGQAPLDPDAQTGAHPAWDLHTRGELIHKRIQSILKSRLQELDLEDRQPIEALLQQLERVNRNLSETANSLESTELELMGVTGEFLFAEEEKRQGADKGAR